MTERAQRRLAAIVSADVVGYTRLMQADEAGTHARLRARFQELFAPSVERYGGRVFKLMGDGLLAEFPSVVAASDWAVDVQNAVARANADVPLEHRIEYRVGVNLGDVIVDGDDLYGDGVNLAARLQEIAETGGICLSDDAYRHARGRVSAAFADGGEVSLKNMDAPVRVWHWASDTLGNINAPGRSAERKLKLPDKPSIAVLPFDNMSGDREQEYFADGMAEDIITALSRMHSLFVIARNSSFTYKGRAVDVKQVGRELGVRYVLEGSVRKSANRVRITGQLIDAGNGAHLWADRFDGALEDVFDLQDKVTASVVNAITPRLEQAEIERAKRKPTESLDAYDYFLRATECLYRQTRESTVDALKLFSMAIQLDSDFAAAYAMAAMCYTQNKAGGWATNCARESAEAGRLARRAVDLCKDDAFVLARAGHTLAYVVEDFDVGRLFIDRACLLNPNLAPAWYASGWLRVWIGDPATAIDHLERFVRISPLDPHLARVYSAVAFAHVFSGQYDEAVRYADRALSESPNAHQALRAAAISNALAGRSEQARGAVARLQEIDPKLRISTLRDQTPLQRPEDMARYVEAMRIAGLPE